MLNETELKILSSFFPEGTEKTTKEIEDRSGYSHERVYHTLKKLKRKGILSQEKVGRALVFCIKEFNDLVFLAFIYYSINRKYNFGEKYPPALNALEEFVNKAEPKLAVVFGSYSKNEVREGSDIDIICIEQEQTCEEISLSLRHKYNLNITPVNVDKEEFTNIKFENPELWIDILEFGIVLKGYELFFKLSYGDDKQ